MQLYYSYILSFADTKKYESRILHLNSDLSVCNVRSNQTAIPIATVRKKKKILGHIFFDPPLRASLFNKVTIYKTCGELFLLVQPKSHNIHIWTDTELSFQNIERLWNKTNKYLTGGIITCGLYRYSKHTFLKTIC